MTNSLKSLFSDAEIQTLERTMVGSRRHPVALLLANESSVNEETINTDDAVFHIARANKTWLDRQKDRLMSTTNLADVASSLSEIRAYGYLVRAEFSVNPVSGKEARPEFIVSAGDGDVVVEVYARQMDNSMRVALDQHRERMQRELDAAKKAAFMRGEDRVVLVTEPIAVQPLGVTREGKPEDTTTTNAISRLSAIKEDEKQLSSVKPNVLWIDLQDFASLGLSLNEDFVFPLLSFNGQLSAGVLWYAFYGFRGAPVFEPGKNDKPIAMAYDGRFRRPTKLSAVIVSFPKATMLLENPWAVHQIPMGFRRRCLRLPRFRIELSLANWAPGQVHQILASQEHQIFAFAGMSFVQPPPSKTQPIPSVDDLKSIISELLSILRQQIFPVIKEGFLLSKEIPRIKIPPKAIDKLAQEIHERVRELSRLDLASPNNKKKVWKLLNAIAERSISSRQRRKAKHTADLFTTSIRNTERSLAALKRFSGISEAEWQALLGAILHTYHLTQGSIADLHQLEHWKSGRIVSTFQTVAGTGRLLMGQWPQNPLLKLRRLARIYGDTATVFEHMLKYNLELLSAISPGTHTKPPDSRATLGVLVNQAQQYALLTPLLSEVNVPLRNAIQHGNCRASLKPARLVWRGPEKEVIQEQLMLFTKRTRRLVAITLLWLMAPQILGTQALDAFRRRLLNLQPLGPQIFS